MYDVRTEFTSCSVYNGVETARWKKKKAVLTHRRAYQCRCQRDAQSPRRGLIFAQECVGAPGACKRETESSIVRENNASSPFLKSITFP